MKKQNVATIILVVFFILFLILIGLDIKYEVLKTYYVLNYVKAFLEAGLIGALADWFAVVAIFDKPMGLNMPHTNLIKTNKDKLANGIASFVVNHFIDKERILSIYNNVNTQTFIYKNLISSNNKEKLICLLKKYQVYQIVKNELNQSITGEKIGGVLANHVKDLKEKQLKNFLQQQLLKIKKEVNGEETKNFIENKIKDHFKTYKRETNFLEKTFFSLKKEMGEFIEPHITSSLIEFINQYLMRSIIFPEKSYVYQKLEQKLTQLENILRNSKYIHRKIENMRDAWLFNEDEFYEFILNKYSISIKNKKVLNSLNYLVNQLISKLIEKREYIYVYIKNTILQWDDEKMSKNIKENVSSDLQFIRINGTLVGGLIGLFIFSLEELIK